MSPARIPPITKYMEEQVKLVHKVVDVVDRLNGKICVTRLQYNVDKPVSSYAQVRLIARKKEEISTNCLHEL